MLHHRRYHKRWNNNLVFHQERSDSITHAPSQLVYITSETVADKGVK